MNNADNDIVSKLGNDESGYCSDYGYESAVEDDGMTQVMHSLTQDEQDDIIAMNEFEDFDIDIDSNESETDKAEPILEQQYTPGSNEWNDIVEKIIQDADE